MEEMDERGRGGGRNGPQGPQSKVSGGDGILATCSVARQPSQENHLLAQPQEAERRMQDSDICMKSWL